MADTLKVDKDVLQEQVQKMKTLASSDALLTAINNMSDVISSSTGDAAQKASALQEAFTLINTNLKSLFTLTADFLDNKHGDFVEADETLSG